MDTRNVSCGDMTHPWGRHWGGDRGQKIINKILSMGKSTHKWNGSGLESKDDEAMFTLCPHPEMWKYTSSIWEMMLNEFSENINCLSISIKLHYY